MKNEQLWCPFGTIMICRRSRLLNSSLFIIRFSFTILFDLEIFHEELPAGDHPNGLAAADGTAGRMPGQRALEAAAFAAKGGGYRLDEQRRALGRRTAGSDREKLPQAFRDHAGELADFQRDLQHPLKADFPTLLLRFVDGCSMAKRWM